MSNDLRAMADTTVVVTHTEEFELYGHVRLSESLYTTAPINNDNKETQ
jgi:hypothetical protein